MAGQRDMIDADIELTREISLPGSVSFDPDSLALHGQYTDELSAYRARKAWAETLENCFLLDDGHDFSLKVKSDLEKGTFSLECVFVTACARYAFWRLTNNQAPEAQYLIETAHIPNSESHQDDLVAASDLKAILDQALEGSLAYQKTATGMVHNLRKMFTRLWPKG